MTDTVAFLMRAMEENWIHARQAEEKRALTAHIVLILASATIGALTFFGLTWRALPFTLLLILLGLYSGAITMKLYERSQYHILRARKLRARLAILLPDAQVEELQKFAENEHREQYSRLMCVHLNSIWLGFYLFLVGLGIVLTLISLIA